MATTERALREQQERASVRASQKARHPLERYPLYRCAWQVTKKGAAAPLLVIVNPPQTAAEMAKLYPGASIEPSP